MQAAATPGVEARPAAPAALPPPMAPPRRLRLDTHRWLWEHGPITLVIEAHGTQAAIDAAHDAAWADFQTVLATLVTELPLLRTDVNALHPPPRGPVAARMWAACQPFRPTFLTPMAAVAGAVAETVRDAFVRPGITRAWVNNGGDIALHLTDDTPVRIGLWAAAGRPHALPPQARHQLDGDFCLTAASPVRGVATSGWAGRSHSLGIADSVTVLAQDAASADAAATLIANAVDVDAPGIERCPAAQLRDDSDLGMRRVTVAVATLPRDAVAQALDAGARCARHHRASGRIHAAVLFCQGQYRVVGPWSPATGQDTGSAPPPAPPPSLPRTQLHTPPHLSTHTPAHPHRPLPSRATHGAGAAPPPGTPS